MRIIFANKRMGADGPPGPLASSGPGQRQLVRAAPIRLTDLVRVRQATNRAQVSC